MKKTMLVIVIFVVYLVSVSAHTDRVVDAVEGHTAPFLKVEKNDTIVSLDQFRGKYLLLTFWSSTDAQSRISCKEYSRMFDDCDSKTKFSHIAINFDCSERLFEEIVRRDNLNPESQFYAMGDNAAQLMKDYHLQRGFKTLLVDPQGQVIAKNPTIKHLTEMFSL